MTTQRRDGLLRPVNSQDCRSPSTRFRPSMAGHLLLCAGVVFFWAACSSTTGTDSGFNARYMDPPQRVWANIQLTLDDLGYEIEESDQHEGTIWATPAEAEGDSKPPLFITQIKRTDVTRIHIYPDPESSAARTDGFNIAAGDFLTALDDRMKGRSSDD
jgi:hypothetical protein